MEYFSINLVPSKNLKQSSSMSENKLAASRYRIINDSILDQRRPFPTLEYLANRCSSLLNLSISASTIEKDIATMRKPHPAGLGAPIVYSKIQKGYVYGEKGFSIQELNLKNEEWEALNFAAQLLYQYKEVPIFANFKNAIERINTRFSLGFSADEPITDPFIQFEQSVDTKGMKWINGLYAAIQKRFAFTFTYHNIYKKETKQYQLVPYLLKEHRNRWYIIGWREDKQQYATFGLDRLSNLVIIEQKHKRRSDFNANQFFEYATGIMKGADKSSEVQLTIQHPISQLVLLEPLHPSQKITSHQAGQIKLSITVFENEEFYATILSLGAHCTVNKPASLRKKIKEMVAAMALNYPS